MRFRSRTWHYRHNRGMHSFRPRFVYCHDNHSLIMRDHTWMHTTHALLLASVCISNSNSNTSHISGREGAHLRYRYKYPPHPHFLCIANNLDTKPHLTLCRSSIRASANPRGEWSTRGSTGTRRTGWRSTASRWPGTAVSPAPDPRGRTALPLLRVPAAGSSSR
jgi:hypothetical protein